MLCCCPATVQGRAERRKKKKLNELRGMYGDAAVAMCRCRVSGSTCMHEGTACCAIVLQQFRAERKEEKNTQLGMLQGMWVLPPYVGEAGGLRI